MLRAQPELPEPGLMWCRGALTQRYWYLRPAWRMALLAGNLRLPIATGARTATWSRRQAESVRMIDRFKTRAWLLGVTVLPVVLAFVIQPLGRRWS